jgi:GNAT superfamily N-acetyltransferase
MPPICRFREIGPDDIDQLFHVRTSVRENAMSMAELAGIGVTPKGTADTLGRQLAGYHCECSDRLAGFSMANVESGEFAVIAVLSEHEGRGIGRELLRLSEELLWSAGHSHAWLWTGTDRSTRALRLYRGAGWVETAVTDGRIYLKKDRPVRVSSAAVPDIVPGTEP